MASLLLVTLLSGLLVHIREARFLPSSNVIDGPTHAQSIQARHGAVASENQRCSLIGVDILKAGGNAVDATIGATLCVGVVNMFSSGIGGGGYITVRIPPSAGQNHSEAWTIDFRETAPALANKTMFVANNESSMYGGLAVGVPGELKGLEEAHRRWGRLPWARLVQPSVLLAQGWKVDHELGRRIPLYADLMLNNPDWRSIFAPQGVLLKEGDPIQRVNLSRTLAIIAAQGTDPFYKGSIGHSIVAKARSTGGVLSKADLENYSVIVTRALEGTYNGQRIMTTHAPTSGPALLHMFNLLEHFNMTVRDGLSTHRLVEAIKYGFAARTKICDPASDDDSDRIAQISTKQYAAQIVGNITDTAHPPDYYDPAYDVRPDHGTSHVSVIDKDGMAVGLTSTVNLVFGSQVLDPFTGIILNDEMDDFTVPGRPNSAGMWPSPYNYPEPNKRPLSSITPIIVEHPNGTLYVSIGGAGGTRIFGSVFQTFLNLNHWGLDVGQAIEFGRMHSPLYPSIVEVDSTYPPELVNDLKARGHNVTVADIHRTAAAVEGAMKQGEMLYAASDPRKSGMAAGY
ncbi:hypothetical protein AMATHDRAFT_6968 [Amanita thiersii Skay4041]|uniref:Glutathione hydrolase n=1 Tax=Amanita thiersii Skay4041 TaxID=703135 RepID=A0A2A9N8T5_9AGAR|nr:hypothetical protein AMATHDRAFT_6968 [Amanita thiersii Skay4041]